MHGNGLTSCSTSTPDLLRRLGLVRLLLFFHCNEVVTSSANTLAGPLMKLQPFCPPLLLRKRCLAEPFHWLLQIQSVSRARRPPCMTGGGAFVCLRLGGRRCFWMDRVGRRTIRETAACLSPLKQTGWEHQTGTKTFGFLDNSHRKKELLVFFPAVVPSHSVVSWEVARNLEIVSLSVRDHGFGVGVWGPWGLLPGAQLPRANALQLQPARGAFQAAAR